MLKYQTKFFCLLICKFFLTSSQKYKVAGHIENGEIANDFYGRLHSNPVVTNFLICFMAHRMCLTGGEEVHTTTARSIQNLAKVFSSYEDEVLAKREELLQCAQDAVAGLKVNADILRIDFEVSKIQQDLDKMVSQLHLTEGDESCSGNGTLVAAEGLKVELEQIRLCSRLEVLLLQKNTLKSRASSDIRNKKVDKLKILSESLVNSALKAENRISENRIQKEEALSFRTAKTSEMTQLEKELAVEIEALERQKHELEAELKKVNASLTSMYAHLRNAREEREQFDEASNQILQHFKMKEDELSRSIASYGAEADVCNAFIDFLESSFAFQSAYTEQKEKQASDELMRYEEYFVNLAVRLLSSYKEKLGPYLFHAKKLVEKLKGSGIAAVTTDEKIDAVSSREVLEQEYANAVSKFVNIFTAVQSIRRQFYSQEEGIIRKDDKRVKDLLGALEKIKDEFESIDRPSLEVESPTIKAEPPAKELTYEIGIPRWETPARESSSSRSRNSTPYHSNERLDYEEDEFSLSTDSEKKSHNRKLQLSEFSFDLELEDNSRDHSPGELQEWIFDHVEKD